MVEVTVTTNRLDVFCLVHYGSNSDADRRRLIAANPQHFASIPTSWLPVGADLLLAPSDVQVVPLLVQGEPLLVDRDHYLEVTD